MSGHIVDMNEKHPLWDKARRDRPFDLRADCPFCGAFPGQPCVLRDWTHIARHEKAVELDKQGRLLPKKILNDLPEEIKKPLLEYCKIKGIDPITLNGMSTDELFSFWCEQMGLRFWGKKMIIVYEAIREVRG